jgi:protein gp37
MEHSRIEWTDHTFNPWVGCTKISPGCTHCYAETLSARFRRPSPWGPKAPRQVTGEAYWRQPLGWDRKAQRQGHPSLVFSGSMCDVFEAHPIVDATRPRLFALIAATPHLDWLLLTKRPDRIADHLPDGWPWPHVWLGTSIETPAYLWRVDVLRTIPAAGRFLSCEPLLEDLGPVNLEGIRWVIIGGESGPGHRPMQVSWVDSLVRQGRDAGAAIFVKQDAARESGQRGALPETLWAYKERPRRHNGT